MAAADGIEHIVTTPHANERYHYDREYLSRLVTHLQELAGPAPRISLGCDFHLSYENMQDAMVNPATYTIEGTNYLLVEFSNYSIPEQIDNFFAMLGSSGITPIITHPERNPILQKNPQRVLQWIELGCAVQVTAGVVTGSWGDRAWRAAKWLLSATRYTSWPATRMTLNGAFPSSPALAMRRKSSATPLSRRCW